MASRNRTTVSLVRVCGVAVVIAGLFACTVSIKPQSTAGKSGAELWAQRCMTCHNMREPASLSDSQWETAISHMRVRAKLNGSEARKILEFLKSSN